MHWQCYKWLRIGQFSVLNIISCTNWINQVDQSEQCSSCFMNKSWRTLNGLYWTSSCRNKMGFCHLTLEFPFHLKEKLHVCFTLLKSSCAVDSVGSREKVTEKYCQRLLVEEILKICVWRIWSPSSEDIATAL